MLQIGIQKILSLLIAIGYVVSIIVQVPGFTLWHDSGSGPGQINVITVGVVLLLALPLIWFPDEIGNATGYWAESSMSMTQVDANKYAYHRTALFKLDTPKHSPCYFAVTG